MKTAKNWKNGDKLVFIGQIEYNGFEKNKVYTFLRFNKNVETLMYTHENKTSNMESNAVGWVKDFKLADLTIFNELGD